MQPQYPQQKRPCKFGLKCNKYQQGNCTFAHDQTQSYQGQSGQGGRGRPGPMGGEDSGMMGGMGGRGGGGRGRPPNNSYNPPRQTQGYNKNYQHQQNPTHNQSPQDPIQQFCRHYQFGGCNRQGSCKRIHGFTKKNDLKRSYYNRDVVSSQATNLGVFSYEGKNYISFKNGTSLIFLQYDFDKTEFTQIDQYSLKQENYHYISTKDQYVYYAYQNQNGFSNFGFYDIFTKAVVQVQNAHKKPVTDVLHKKINGIQVILSSSIDGFIKVWKLENNELTFDQNLTQIFKKCYDNGNQNIQIEFLDHKQIGGTRVLVAGTNDGRLLFWIGDQMNYQQAVFPPQYSKVLSAKFVLHQQSWVGIVLVWTKDNTKSALIGIDLGTFNPSLLLDLPIKNPLQLMSSIETLDDMLLISNVGGLITIYKIPNFEQKIGFIMHQNSVANMLNSNLTLSTGITLTNLYVLERPSKKGGGSLSVYTLK